MKATEIKSGEDLQTFLKEREENETALTKANADLTKTVADLHEQIEKDAKAADEKFATLTVLAKGKWRETQPELVLCEGIGRIVKAQWDRDYKTLEKLGARPNRDVGNEEWKSEGWDVLSKSDLGTPMRGDSSTLGGSYLIPAEYAREVLRIAFSASAMMPLVRNVPMTGRTVYWPVEGTTLSYSWPTNEATAKTEKSPTFTQVTLSAKTAAAWITLTEELTEDSIVELGAYFRDVFGEAWGYEFDYQCLVSNAAPFTGAMRASSINTVTMDAGKTTGDAVKVSDLGLLIAALTTQAKRLGARFIMHPTVWDTLCNERDAQGQYVLARPTDANPASAKGYPVTLSDAMPDVSSVTAGTPFILFCNPKYIIHGDRVGFEFRVFDQTEGTMQYDRVYLRARLRQGFLVGTVAGIAVLKTAAA